MRGGEHMKKKTLATMALVTVLGMGVLGSTSAFAQTTTDQNPMSSLVQSIATKFGLKEADVQAVFDAEREKHHTQMQATFEKKLTQYVIDGKITEAQKQLILQKRAELEKNREAKRESNTSLTPEERKSQMEAEKSALQAWAKENGIDMQYLMLGGRGHGGFKGMGMRN